MDDDTTAAEPSASGAATGTASATDDGGGHFKKMLPIWAVLAVAGDLIFYFVAGPHVPPGRMTSSAGGASFDFTVLFLVALPVMVAVWTYLGYALWNWRASRVLADPVAGPYSRGHAGIQTAWMAVSSTIVLGLFIFGTVELVAPAGAGGGEGSDPIWTPTSGTVLPVQVIAQQWKFTYRYPTLGGFETTTLVIPDHTTIAFHVTSLDVIHDFWAYQLGVKADANPQQDNIAYTTTDQLGPFTVRCDELCGLWHGAMFNSGKVLTKQQFFSWAGQTRTALAANTKFLPPFSWTYVPDDNGADGGYYPDNVDPYSKVEQYGAQKAKV